MEIVREQVIVVGTEVWAELTVQAARLNMNTHQAVTAAVKQWLWVIADHQTCGHCGYYAEPHARWCPQQQTSAVPARPQLVPPSVQQQGQVLRQVLLPGMPGMDRRRQM